MCLRLNREQSGCDGNRVHLHVSQNVCNFERMDEIGLARGTALSCMVLLGEVVGFLDAARDRRWAGSRGAFS